MCNAFEQFESENSELNYFLLNSSSPQSVFDCLFREKVLEENPSKASCQQNSFSRQNPLIISCEQSARTSKVNFNVGSIDASIFPSSYHFFTIIYTIWCHILTRQPHRLYLSVLDQNHIKQHLNCTIPSKESIIAIDTLTRFTCLFPHFGVKY